MDKEISMTSMIILLLAITSIQETRAGAFTWTKEAFASRECNGYRQPVVEFWRFNGLQYLFFSQRVTWEEGRMLCLNYNARLAILDSMEKAVNVAKSIADSNIEMQDSWIGGRRVNFTWRWINEGIGLGAKYEIPMEPNVEDYPPWTRDPSRPTKECLAIDRRSHDHPNFIDLDCRLQRPIICEKQSDETTGVPVPSKWIQIGRSTYTLYHGKVTWREAATFCRAQSARLAILKTSTVINILTNGMTKTRPDFETVWIGGYFSYGQWIWMATGSILNPLTDESGYPPWRFGRPEKNDGCLLLDRHLEDSTNFIETTCDRKRDFVCEEYPEDDDEDWLNEPVKFAHGNSTYIIYPVDKTWSDSRSFCNERGSVLAHVGSIDTLNLIIEAMGDHPREIHHLWLGGEFRSKTDQWHWIDNDEEISKLKNDDGFPPWARLDVGLDHDPASSSCLNLDRTDHVKPHIYALDCASKQPFVCEITCDVPPSVKNGTWKCYEVAEGRECTLECDSGLMVMGVRNVTCTFFNGWVTGLHWLEFPMCIAPREYTLRMIRSVSHDVQKSAGYYIVIDHAESIMRSLSLEFAEQLIKAFPVSHNLQMGMTCFSTYPPSRLSFNQTDNCEILEAIHSMKKQITKFTAERKNDANFSNDISMFNGRRILIIAIIDSKRAGVYAEAIEQFKSLGHHVTMIGLEEDWKMLLPLATVGYDRRSNLFLLDDLEFEKIIRQLEKMEQKSSKCKNLTGIDSETKTVPEVTEIIDTISTSAPAEEERTSNVPEESINQETIETTASPQMEKEIENGYPERRAMNSEEETKVVSDKNDESNSGVVNGNVTKNDEDLPRIYSEQGPKRDLGIRGRENVAKDSRELDENGQGREDNDPRTTTNRPVKRRSDEAATSASDGNGSAE